MSTAAEEVAQVNTERSDVSTGFAADPENAHISFFVVLDEFQLVD